MEISLSLPLPESSCALFCVIMLSTHLFASNCINAEKNHYLSSGIPKYHGFPWKSSCISNEAGVHFGCNEIYVVLFGCNVTTFSKTSGTVRCLTHTIPI